MKLTLCHQATTFPQPGFSYGFAVRSDDKPGLLLHLLAPRTLWGAAVPGYRNGTLMVYAIDHTGKDAFTPKDMPAPSRDMISALKVQWSELSSEYIRYVRESLDTFEKDENTTDHDERSNVDCSEISFGLLTSFFAAPDFQISPKPLSGGIGYLVSALPLPPL